MSSSAPHDSLLRVSDDGLARLTWGGQVNRFRRTRRVGVTLLLSAVIGVVLPPATAHADFTLWNPSVNTTEPACDALWTHKQAARSAPGQSRVLTITPPPGLTVNSLSLIYSINGSPNQTIVSATTSVTLPGTSLVEGARLDYAFAVSFTVPLGYSGPCQTLLARIPHRNGFHSVATSVTDIRQAPYNWAVTRAFAALSKQPQFEWEYGYADEICAAFFVAPTPCTEISAAAALPSPSLPSSTLEPSGWTPPSTGGGSTVCTYSPSSRWLARFHAPTGAASGEALAAPYYKSPTKDAANGTIGLHIGAAALTASSYHYEAKAETGFYVGWTTPPNVYGFTGDLTLRFSTWGRREGFAAASVPTAQATADPRAVVTTYYEDVTEGTTGAISAAFNWRSTPATASTGYTGLGDTATVSNPYEAPDGVQDWSANFANFFFIGGHTYRFWIKLSETVDASGGSGAAFAGTDVDDSQSGFKLQAINATVVPRDATTLTC